MAEPGVDDDARRRIAALERDVHRLREEVAALQAATTWHAVPGDAAGAPPAPAAPGPPADPESAADAAAHARTPSRAEMGRTPPRMEGRAGLEAIIGTRWLAAAGVVLTVAAAALFLRLAIVRGWIGPLAQLLLIAALGILVWVLGGVLHGRPRFRGFAEVLAAGGVAITAFSAFASHGLPRYAGLGVTVEASSGMLAAIALAALADAALRRARTQAGMSIALVVVTGLVAREWTAFAVAYPVAMTAALLVAGAWRRWTWMPAAALPGPFVLLTVQAAVGATASVVGLAAAVLIAVFTAVGLRTRQDADDAAYGAAVQAAAWLVGWGLLVWSVRQQDRFDADGWLTLTLGAAALGLALLPHAHRALRWGWAAAALPMLVLWAPLLPWPAATAYIWTGELLLAALLHRRWRHGTLMGAEAALAGLLAIRFLVRELPRIDDRVPLFGADVTVVVLAAAAAVAAWSLGRRRDGRDWQAGLAQALLGAGALYPVLLAIALWPGPAGSVAIAVWGAALTVAGFVVQAMEPRIAGLSVFAIVLLRVVFVDLASVDAAWRVLAFFLIGALLLGVSFLYVRLAKRLA